MELLGKTVRDRLSGLTGLAAAHVVLINGNVRYSIQPMGDGTKVVDAHDVDEHTLEVTDGPTLDVILPDAEIAASLGDMVRDMLTNREGIVDMVVTSLNGCTYLRVTEPVNKSDKLMIRDSIYGTHDRFTLIEPGAFARLRAEADEKKKILLAQPKEAVVGKENDPAPAAAPQPARRPPGGPTTRSLRD